MDQRQRGDLSWIDSHRAKVSQQQNVFHQDPRASIYFGKVPFGKVPDGTTLGQRGCRQTGQQREHQQVEYDATAAPPFLGGR